MPLRDNTGVSSAFRQVQKQARHLLVSLRKEIRGTRGLREKRPSEIFAAVTRWIDAGLVKRRARGVYERTG